MEHIQNKQVDTRFKPNHINSHIKYKGLIKQPPSKKQWLSDWIKKQGPEEIPFKYEDTNKHKIKNGRR